jgi:hypothetical protein
MNNCMEQTAAVLEDSRSSASQPSPQFTEPEVSLLCSKEPATVSYPKPDDSTPHSFAQFI